MEIKILSDVNNHMLGRREIRALVTQESKTASKEEIKTEICRQLNISPETSIVTNIRQKFGLRQSECTVHSYKSKEAMDSAEPKYIIKRATKVKGEKTEEKKEEKKDEKKEERQKEKNAKE